MDHYILVDKSGLIHVLWRLSNGRYRHVVDHANGLRERMIDVHDPLMFIRENMMHEVVEPGVIAHLQWSNPGPLSASKVDRDKLQRRHLW